ncbi:MAG: GFA family protein [Kofleriaceae bacterium]
MLNGSCLCGGIRFEVTGPHSKIGFCHCSKCRKCSGGGYAACITVAGEHFHWLAGEDLITAGPKHSFCRTCGAPMPEPNPKQTVYAIPIGCFDGDPALAIGDHIYVGSKAAWEVIGDNAPQHAENGPPLARDQT